MDKLSNFIGEIKANTSLDLEFKEQTFGENNSKSITDCCADCLYSDNSIRLYYSNFSC